jgi:hypothetical protein
MTATSPKLPQVNVSEHGKVRYLHLGTAWVQGSMWLKKQTIGDRKLMRIRRFDRYWLTPEGELTKFENLFTTLPGKGRLEQRLGFVSGLTMLGL